MSKFAELFDGTRLEFPDDTSDSVIEKVAKQETLARRKEEPKEESSMFRQAADIPVGVAKGFTQGVRMIADAFGADNPVSKTIRGAEDYLGELMSAQAKDDQKKVAQIMKEAEDKGVADQVIAGLKAFTVAPVDLLSQALGTAGPAIVAALAVSNPVGAAATAIGVGATMGAGTLKGSIYDSVKEELSKVMPADQAEARAVLAQEYGGQNLDQILSGAAIGGLSSMTGVVPRLIPSMAKNIMAKAATKSTTGRALSAVAGEAIPEGIQGGQEQLAQNLALQREGVETPTFRGVAGAAATEGLAGGVLGGGVHAFGHSPTAQPQTELPPMPSMPVAPMAEAPEAPALPVEPPAAPFKPTVVPQQYSTQEGIDYATGVAGGAGYTPADLLTPGAPGVREQAQRMAVQRLNNPPSDLLTRGGSRNPEAPPAPRMPMTAERRAAAQQAAFERAGEELGYVDQRQPFPVSPAQTQPYTRPVPQSLPDRQRAIDAEAVNVAQAQNEPLAFDRNRLMGAAAVRGEPRAVMADPNPMAPRAARQRLAVMKEEAAVNGEDPNALAIVPHPTMGGRFAIEKRFPAQALYPYQKQVSPQEVSQRLEAAALAGSERQRLAEDQPRQQMISRAMANIEARGGVASQREAEILREANMGRPYNRIDSSLDTPSRFPANSVDERLTALTGIELQKRPRESVAQEDLARTAEYNAEQDRRRQLERAQKERETANLLQAQNEAPKPPQPSDVMAAFATPAPFRTADQVLTIKQARARLNESDVGVLEMAGQDPSSMRNAVERIQREQDAKFSLNPTPEMAEVLADPKPLLNMLKRFGLEKVGLRLVDSIRNGTAEGQYAQELISIAMDNTDPMGVLRHESIHALKELGAFTDAEWKVLSKAAKDKWINQFYNRDMQDKYQEVYLEAYGNLDGFPEYMQEEAIAQAFRFYTETKPPAGMIANLMRRLNAFFESLQNFFAGKGFQSVDEMFLPNRILADIERGAITLGRAEIGRMGAPAYSFKPDMSTKEGIMQDGAKRYADALKRHRIGQSDTRGIIPQVKANALDKIYDGISARLEATGLSAKEAEDLVSQKVLPAARGSVYYGDDIKFSLRSPAVEIVSNEVKKPELSGKVTVDKVGEYFDNKVKEEFGKKLDYKDQNDFDRAVQHANDEVAYQLAQENSGLDWYEQDVKKAFEDTQKVIPELKSEQKRLLFSVIAGIMSPQTNARDNWFIAAKAFQHYIKTKTIPGNNPDTGGLWQGGTQSANKKVQLEFLNKLVSDLGEKPALEWLTGQHSVKEVNEFRQKYGNIKSGIGGKLTDQVIGLYAFGPKVGPFVSNLNGIHDVTVDKWITRTFNRYFGTMVDADGKIIDAPTEPQRKSVKQLVNEAAKNANIKPYQVQSLLWFFEQRLFRELGTPAPSYGFSDGGRKFLTAASGGNEDGRGNAPAKAEKFSLKAPTTPAFKQWFGNSKVVNPDDTPKVMYHGTARIIDEFIPKQAGAIFVTDNPEFAETFSKDSIQYQVNNQKNLLQEAFASMNPNDQLKFLKKAYRLGVKQNAISKKAADQALEKINQGFENNQYPTTNEFNDVSEFFDEEIKNDLQSGQLIMPLYVRAENPFDFKNPEHVNSINPKPHEKEDIEDGNWETIESPDVQDAIRAAGFDGFYVQEGGNKNLAVYNPNQVKSAIGNTGAFSRGAGDIRYSIAPLTKLTENDPTSGQAVINAAKSGLNFLSNAERKTSARGRFVDKYSALRLKLKRLSPEGGAETNGVLRADQLKNAQAQTNNLIKGGLNTGVPVLNDDGTIIIERSEDNLARSAQLADKLDMNPHVAQSGYSGRQYVAEIARIRRGQDIIAEDAEIRAEAARMIVEADRLEADLKANIKKGVDPQTVASAQNKINAMRKQADEDSKINREKEVKPEHIAWAEAQMKAVPEVQEIFDIWKNVNTALVNLYEATGVISSATADKYRANKNYVPLFKSQEDMNQDGSMGFIGGGIKRPPKLFKLQGAEMRRNIWENVQKQYAAIIAASYENQTRREAVRQLELVSADGVKTIDPAEGGANLVYRDNGKDVYVRVDDPNLLMAFQSLPFEINPVIKLFGGFSKVLRAGALLNPMFWLKQLIRDPISATITGGHVVTPVHSAAEFMRIIMNNSEEARILASRGVIGQFDSTLSMEEYIDSLGKEKRKPSSSSKLLTKFLEVHEASDAATRVAIFKKAKAKALRDGKSESQAVDYAVHQARESINFAITGSSPTIAALRQVIPFMNATIVGLDTLYRAMFGYGLNPEEKSKVQRMFATRALSLVAMSFFYAMAFQDNDEYKEQPDYVKDGNWLFPVTIDGRRTFVKIPVPYEIGFLFKALPEMMVRYMAGTSSGKEVLASFRAGLIQNLPTGGNPIPQAIKPLAEVITNHSFFTNAPLEGMGDQRLPVAQRGEKASEFAKMMSKFGLDQIGLSPVKIDALTKGYFAEFGTFFNELIDFTVAQTSGKEKPPKNFENMPVLKSFLTDPNVSKAVGDFYKIEHEAEEVSNLFSQYKNQGNVEGINEIVNNPEMLGQMAAAKPLGKIQMQMAKIKNAMKIIESDQSIPPSERRKQLNELQAVFNDLGKVGANIAAQLKLPSAPTPYR